MSGSPRPREPRMRANAISRPPTEPDPARTSSQVKDSPFDSVRRSQTPQTTMEFPDTEEVTGSNPVRPTRFFENPSSGERHNESQRPAVLSLNSWSGRSTLRPTPRFPGGLESLVAD